MFKKMVENIIVIVFIAFILWMAASWIEVCHKNLSKEPRYNKYNFWVNAVELFEENENLKLNK